MKDFPNISIRRRVDFNSLDEILDKLLQFGDFVNDAWDVDDFVTTVISQLTFHSVKDGSEMSEDDSRLLNYYLYETYGDYLLNYYKNSMENKGLKENINRIKGVMGLIIEDKQNIKHPVQIYMNGEGSDFADEYQGEMVKIPVVNTLGNEPFKDMIYMKEKGKSYVDALNNGEEWMNEPIVAIVHPYDPSKYVVVDGNHRLYAYKETNTPEVNAIIVPHEDVVLMKNEWGNENQESINLADVLDNKEIVDRYFVKPDGTNNFQSEEIKEGEITERCWKGYTQKGMKTMFGKRYPNCVKKTKK